MGQQGARGEEKKLLGRGKEIVGVITGDSALEREGFREEAEGAAQEDTGKARRKRDELVGEGPKASKKQG
jgi:uncharacterized protein YjbJ (UPF0337 family)